MDNTAYLGGGRGGDRAVRGPHRRRGPRCPGPDVSGVGRGGARRTRRRDPRLGAQPAGRRRGIRLVPQRRRTGRSATPSSFSRGTATSATRCTPISRARDPGDPCWNFAGTNQVVGFWPRRQMNEINVHACDAALAAGAEFVVEPVEAADGIDEILVMFGPRLALRGMAPTLSGTDHDRPVRRRRVVDRCCRPARPATPRSPTTRPDRSQR